jgi:hypothetical protein
MKYVKESIAAEHLPNSGKLLMDEAEGGLE